MTTLLIKRWKEMIPFKRFFYISLIFTAILQILSQGVGIAHDVGALTHIQEFLSQLFFVIYYCGLVSTVVMCTYFQAMVSKVLYGIYFHQSHSWMRKGAESYSFNEKFRIFTKYYTIGMTLIWTIAFIILVPFTLICSMVYYMDGGNTRVGSILGIWSIISVAIVGLVNSGCAIITGVLNLTLVLLLSRYLLQNRPVPIPRRNACKKLVLLTFGQFYMAIINSISIILGAIGIWYPYLFILTGVIHRFVFLLFAICVSFSFGPMDYFHYELKLEGKKKPHGDNTQSSCQTSEIQLTNQKTSNSFNIDSKAFRKASEISSMMMIKYTATNKQPIYSPFNITSSFGPQEAIATDQLRAPTNCNDSKKSNDSNTTMSTATDHHQTTTTKIDNIQYEDIFVDIPLND
ncbi:predicted protein [Naegleria gruberi]|uniref:Predicted protein n=1 Tax=Naegleria gruberi TaxID=5762 RepID=D2VW75_NAEGR|nr:uncharacterized protein NAEGRDRAFT_73282 [Naegleria gruberi]EFC39032.1 predicted protein [Naegleria gruberi]|eukprot:XP_002671776.1 predicted protein [Naegleria gruberi strain NEG-M]